MSWLIANLELDGKRPTAEELAVEAAAREQKREIAAEWRVPTKGKIYIIEFEHGTTSGKRVLWIDGKV